MAKTPDECVNRIVAIFAWLVFIIYPAFVMLYQYTTYLIFFPFYAIWWPFILSLLAMGLILRYRRKYYSFKKSNINPIINILRDLKELQSLYEKTENENIEKEMERCGENLKKRIIAFLEPEKQFVLVTTHSYNGLIGTVKENGSGQSHWINFSENKNSVPDKVLNLYTIQSIQPPIKVVQLNEKAQITSIFFKSFFVASTIAGKLFKVRSPDECARNIVRIAEGIFLIYLITLLFVYWIVPFSWTIWFLLAVVVILVILVLAYLQKYYHLKKGNVVPIKSTIRDLRDLKELKGQYEKTKSENIKKAMEACWEKLVEQMMAYLEPEKQYIWVITKGYHGIIGQVEKHTDVNHVFFSNTKGVYIIPNPEVSLDLSEIEYLEGIQDLKGFYKQHGSKKAKKSWLKALFEKL